MNEPITKEKRDIWSWHTLYILLQWPFILIGAVLWFAYEGMELGCYVVKRIQKMVEDNV